MTAVRQVPAPSDATMAALFDLGRRFRWVGDVAGYVAALEAAPLPGAAAWLWAEDFSPLPDRYREREWWARLFRAEGFTRDFRPAPAPVSPLRLFRGAVPGEVDGMAWTPSVELARAYADSDEHRVWVADVPPERVLAVFPSQGTTGWFADVEAVADVRGVPVREVRS